MLVLLKHFFVLFLIKTLNFDKLSLTRLLCDKEKVKVISIHTFQINRTNDVTCARKVYFSNFVWWHAAYCLYLESECRVWFDLIDVNQVLSIVIWIADLTGSKLFLALGVYCNLCLMWFKGDSIEFHDISFDNNLLMWNLIGDHFFGFEEFNEVLFLLLFQVFVDNSYVASLRMLNYSHFNRIFGGKYTQKTSCWHFLEWHSWVCISSFWVWCVNKDVFMGCPLEIVKTINKDWCLIIIKIWTHLHGR